MIWLWTLAVAHAAEVGATFDATTLRPGVAVGLEVVATETGGGPVKRPPAVTVQGGSYRFAAEPGADGRWRYIVVPSVDAERVDVLVEVEGRRVRLSEVLKAPAPSEWLVPARVEVDATETLVKFLIRGDQLPPPESVQVAVGEGQVQAVVAREGGLEVQLQLDPRSTPRVVPVLVRDGRGVAAPSLVSLRVRAHPRLPLRAEAGTVARVKVGERSYGPFTADANGKIDARVEQYPGESQAVIMVRDPAGSEGSSTWPLAVEASQSLVLLADRDAGGEGSPPVIFVASVQSVGGAGAVPSCRTPADGLLPSVSMGGGLYMMPLAPDASGRGREARVACDSTSGASASVRVPWVEGYAQRLLLQVWPTVLATDLPVAEVRVALEDLAGDRLPVAGVRVQAGRGDVVTEARESELLLADYLGQEAVESGEDLLRAIYERPPGSGAVHAVTLGWAPAPAKAGEWGVSVRALDRLGRPLEGVPVELIVKDVRYSAVTDARGWGSVSVALGAEETWLQVEGRAGGLARRAVVLRGVPGQSGPSAPDLSAEQRLTLAAGRLAGISVDVQPPILRTGQGSVAYVTLRLEDKSGGLVTDAQVSLEASEGRVGRPALRPDGTWIATYEPPPGDRPRRVQITAQADDLKASAGVDLEPRLGRVEVGPTVGVITNFGQVTGLVVNLDADFRTPFLAEGLVLRAGTSLYSHASEVDTGLGAQALVTGTMVPSYLGAVLRRDRGGFGVWGGFGLVLAVHRTSLSIDGELAARGTALLPGGAGLAGAGYRLGWGELALDVRYLWIPGSGGDFGFVGNLGGLGVGVGFRLVY